MCRTDRHPIRRWRDGSESRTLQVSKFSYFGRNHLLIRIIGCITMVLVTYNPSGNSIYHWFVADLFSDFKIKLLLIIIFGIALYFMIRIIYSNNGMFGVGLLLSMIALSIYELHYRSIEWSLGQITFIFLAEIVFAIYLALALSVPHIVTRLSGQTQKRFIGG